jgi:hypothetical protein
VDGVASRAAASRFGRRRVGLRRKAERAGAGPCGQELPARGAANICEYDSSPLCLRMASRAYARGRRAPAWGVGAGLPAGDRAATAERLFPLVFLRVTRRVVD